MPRPEPSLSIRALTPLLEGLKALGADNRAVLATAGIAEQSLGDPDATVPQSAVMRFWAAAVAVTRDPDLGLHLADAAPITSFEIHAYAVLSSPNFREALQRACRYQRLLHDATVLTLDASPAGGCLRHALPDGTSVPRQPAEFLVALWMRFGRLVAGEIWWPAQVDFAHPAPAATGEHRRVFGRRITFSSGRTALTVPTAMLDRVNPRADPALVAVLDRFAARLLAGRPRSSRLSERVRAHMMSALGGTAPGAKETAAGLSMSARTLHRQLHAEGTGFRAVVEQVRRERATVLLRERGCCIAEVAFLLGFSDLSAFYRAFRRWTGHSPAEFRRRAQRNGN